MMFSLDGDVLGGCVYTGRSASVSNQTSKPQHRHHIRGTTLTKAVRARLALKVELVEQPYCLGTGHQECDDGDDIICVEGHYLLAFFYSSWVE